MAAVRIYGKKKTRIFIYSRTKKALRLNLHLWHRGLKVYQIYTDDDPRMTVDLFAARSNCQFVQLNKIAAMPIYGKNT